MDGIPKTLRTVSSKFATDVSKSNSLKLTSDILLISKPPSKTNGLRPPLLGLYLCDQELISRSLTLVLRVFGLFSTRPGTAPFLKKVP